MLLLITYIQYHSMYITTRLIRNIILLALLHLKEKGITVLLNNENYLPNDTAQPTTCTLRYRYIKVTIHRQTFQDKSAETYPG